MHAFAIYLSSVDGTRTWDDIEPLFDAAFDPEATFLTADGEVDLARWKQMAHNLVNSGSVISDLELRTSDGRTAMYKLTITTPGESPRHLAARAVLRDGRVLRVEPTDPAAYADLFASNT